MPYQKKDTSQRVTIQTSLGEAEAVKAGQGEPWETGYPWGDDRFYGSRPEVEAHMRKNRKRNDPEFEGEA